MPGLVSALQADFGIVSPSLLSTNAAEFKRINQRFGYFFALGHAYFNFSANSGASFPAILTKPTPTGQLWLAKPKELETF
jgi:hypothetical protein